MTSTLRAYAQIKEGLTKFLKPESPSYDNGTNVVLFPFTYNNGVLDITYDGNNFESQMVDISENAPRSETDTIVRILGGPRLVNSLGENFKEYIRAWRAATIDAGSPINIYIAPQVLRVQQADISNITANSNESFVVGTSPPVSDDYIAGSTATQYDTTYVFKTPLTFTIVEGGVTTYITFRTVLDQE